MVKILYFLALIIGFIPVIVFLHIYHSSLYFVIALAFYIIIYKPLVDYIYIKKRKLYTEGNILKKYPFWSSNLLRKMYFE
jgi:hypothetical protein